MGEAPIYYEDLEVGLVVRFGSYLVARDDMLEFAARYDPQPFHLNDAAAAETHFGQLAASGWHTAAMTMRMMVDHYISQMASLGGAGLDELSWPRPVYPGDTLSCVATVLEKRRSRSRPELGLFRHRVETFNQNGELVQVLSGTGLIAVREPQQG